MTRIKYLLLPLSFLLLTAATSPSFAQSKTIADYKSDAVFFMLLQRFDSLEIAMTQAIETYPRESFFYQMRGRGRFIQDDPKNGMADLDKAIEVQPEIGENYFWRGQLKVQLQKYEEALDDYNQGIELDPGYQFGYGFRGQLHVLMANFEQAESDLNTAELIDPDNPMVYKYRGMARLRTQGTSAGCADMLRAKEMGARGMDRLIEDYCADLFSGNTMDTPDGVQIFKSPMEITAENAQEVTSFENEPGSLVQYFFASRIRGDEKWKEVCQPEGQMSERMKYSLDKYDNWKFTKFHLVSKEEASPGKWWVKVYFAIEIERNGKIIRDDGQDEATVREWNGKFIITEVPN